MAQPVHTDLQRFVPSADIDAEVLVGGYLRFELGGDYKVCTELTESEDFTVPVIRVQRAGGQGQPGLILDEALMDIDVWGKTRNDTKTAMRRARALMAAAKGVWFAGAVITKVEELDGPAPRLEPDPKLYRWGFTHGVSIHPA